MNEDKTQETRDLDGMIKSGDAFRFISGFEKSKAYEVTEDGVTRKFIEFVGSSDQEDLVGDVMTLEALKEMVASAQGTIMLRDHNRSTDKVFGWITEASLVKDNGKNVIVFRAEIDDEDNANVRIWKSIGKGYKLGASVTVIILSKADNPNRKDGLIIKSVKLLEISIVTIPCNQDSWTLAATASKALAISEATANKQIENEVIMNEKTEAIEETAPAVGEEIEKTPAGEPVVNPQILTINAMNAHLARRKASDETGEPPEITEVIAKGLFVEEQSKRQPGLWDLFDILCSVKWNLMDRKWATEYAGIKDDYDYVAEFGIACTEFAAAAQRSFAWSGGFEMPGEEAESSDDLASDAIADDEETMKNALSIQKSFQAFAEIFVQMPVEQKPTLKSIGSEIIELAQKAGIPVAAEAVESAAPTDEFVRKSPIFLEAEIRAAKAEADVEKLTQQLEVAKAGLETAAEAIGFFNRQPLQIGQR